MAAAEWRSTNDLLTHAEAAAILDVHPVSVANMVQTGVLLPLRRGVARQLPRQQVEALAIVRWSATRTRSRYFLNTNQAAEVLGVTRARVYQLTRRGFLPAVETGRRAPARLYGPSRWRLALRPNRVRATSTGTR